MKKIKNYLVLHIFLIIFSFCGVFSKMASSYELLSFRSLLFYGISIALLFIYTLGWQQILKRIPLVIAFLNKSITIVWSMIWGLLFFQENITTKMIIGAIVLLVGVSLVVTDNE